MKWAKSMKREIIKESIVNKIDIQVRVTWPDSIIEISGSSIGLS
jgi:hypothetical protein